MTGSDPTENDVWPITHSVWPSLEVFRCVESGLRAAELFLQSDFFPRGPNTLLYNATGSALLMAKMQSATGWMHVQSFVISANVWVTRWALCKQSMLFGRRYLLWPLWSRDRIIVLWLQSARTRIILNSS